MGYRLIIGSKLSGLLRVTSANFIVLAFGMVTAMLIPLAVSVENYGYWQLFSLYSSYAGFFMLGFNDGIHLNYADMNYDEVLFSRFRTFRNIVILLSVMGVVLVSAISLLFFDTEKQFIAFAVAVYILAVGVNGFCAYTNQITMRFKEYSRGMVSEKAIFVVLTLGLLFINIDNYKWYIVASIFSSFGKLIYNVIVNKEVMYGKGLGIIQLSGEIKNNFLQGFILMIAVILNGSIIVGGRLIVENKFGIETFGSFSFALNTMIIASVFIVALSQVFYPILKRLDYEDFERIIKMIDISVAFLGAMLLLSYFAIYVIILIVFKNYTGILEYLMFLYPLFVFQCKSSLIIINIYKIKKNMHDLLINNALGIMINIGFTYAAYLMFGTITAIAVATLLGYVAWYYICLIQLYFKEKWEMTIDNFLDVLFVGVFTLSCLPTLIPEANIYCKLLLSILIYIVFLAIFIALGKKYIYTHWKLLKHFMKD